MKLNSFLKAFLLGFLVIFVASCDKDVNEIGADFVDSDHYAFQTANYAVTAYNKDLGPVATQNLPVNPLGYYNNPVFGKTKANFVTQLELATENPTFYDLPNLTVDSVYLYVPYFSHVSDVDANNNYVYELDSIHGSGKMKLDVYRSNYYLRNLDPNPISGLLEQQNYWSDQTDIDSQTSGARLNDRTDLAGAQNDNFEFKNTPIVFYKADPVTGVLLDPLVERDRLAPGIYLDLNKTQFENDVIHGGANILNNNAFKNWFRGITFKVTPHSSALDGAALAQLNFSQGRIVIRYTDKTSASNTARIKKTLTLNMKGYCVSLQENLPNPTSAAYNQYTSTLAGADPTNGDQKLYLKGGAGSMAIIDLFNGQKNDNSPTLNQMRDEHWLINEANLVFNIDHSATAMGANDVSLEPNRIYLYDFVNNKPLIDYYFDTSTYQDPKFNKLIHSGIIRKASANARGTTYKIRITNHIRNLIKYGGTSVTKDSTNVKLGLVVTENINIVNTMKLKNPFSYMQVNPATGLYETKTAKYVPSMSVANPLGTVLYGSNASVPENLRLKLEVVYTKPDQN